MADLKKTVEIVFGAKNEVSKVVTDIGRNFQTLGDLTSKKIKMKVREDRGLIGGIVVRIGDLVLDGSIKAHLRGLREPR